MLQCILIRSQIGSYSNTVDSLLVFPISVIKIIIEKTY
jgi:hypothetical protein